MNLFDDGKCTDAQRDIMCHSVYLGRLDCRQTGPGDVGGLAPICLTELNVHNNSDFKPRQYRRRDARGDKPDHGFGFGFAEFTTTGVHKGRVLVIDYSKWTIRHYVHFLCKFILLSDLVLNKYRFYEFLLSNFYLQVVWLYLVLILRRINYQTSRFNANSVGVPTSSIEHVTSNGLHLLAGSACLPIVLKSPKRFALGWKLPVQFLP